MLGTPFLGAGLYKITRNGNVICYNRNQRCYTQTMAVLRVAGAFDTCCAPRKRGGCPDVIHAVLANMLWHGIHVTNNYTKKRKNCQILNFGLAKHNLELTHSKVPDKADLRG